MNITVAEGIHETLLKEPQDSVNERLIRLSFKLQRLLPDPSLGPMERIERLARLIPNSYQLGQHHRTARSKLIEIEERLNSLVPDQGLTFEQKIDFLVGLADDLVPEQTDRLCQKLQFIGDNRLRDNGAIPYAGWDFTCLDLTYLVETKRLQGLDPNGCSYIDESKFLED